MKLWLDSEVPAGTARASSRSGASEPMPLDGGTGTMKRCASKIRRKPSSCGPRDVERVASVYRRRLGRRGDHDGLGMDLMPRLSGSHVCAYVGGNEHAGGACHRSKDKAQYAEQRVAGTERGDNG